MVIIELSLPISDVLCFFEYFCLSFGGFWWPFSFERFTPILPKLFRKITPVVNQL